jgi:hypothetical protein
MQSHFDRIGERIKHCLIQCGASTIPEERSFLTHSDRHQAGRIARANASSDTYGYLSPIGIAFAGDMTRGTADGAVSTQMRVIEERVAQSDALRAKHGRKRMTARD